MLILGQKLTQIINVLEMKIKYIFHLCVVNYQVHLQGEIFFLR